MTQSIDLSKLEALSCLKIKEESKDSMISSISDVFTMLHDIDKINVSNFSNNSNNPTQLANDEVNESHLFNKNEKTDGIYTTDGLFLAPKVLNKD